MSYPSISTQLSSPVRLDRWLLLLALSVALGITIVLGIGIGPVSIGPLAVISALRGHAEGPADIIVNQVRLPRVLAASMIGASMAMAGALLQGVTRNPLADPHIFGISSGAGLVAVSVIVFLPHLATGSWLVVPIGLHIGGMTLIDELNFGTVQPLSFAGGMAAGMLAYLMAWRGGVSPARLALAGIAVTSMLSAISFAVLVSSAFAAQIGLRWLIGGLLGTSMDEVRQLSPYFVIGTAISLLMARQVNVISLGDDIATSLGQHVERTRLVLVATAALLASSAVSIGGLIGFVGLIVPHLVRLVIGNDYRYLIPASALTGAILLVIADTAARTVFDPVELPVGVFTAVLGGPVFILLVRGRA